ncbi:hypothetical protein HS5_02510 [Acidianus sp. HS-5]|nr:hypothetical protein HS5_02510 [Acidianus sp. HS-5]
MDNLLPLVDLDIDDHYINPLLKIMLQKERLLRENTGLFLSRFSYLSPSQQLRVLDLPIF